MPALLTEAIAGDWPIAREQDQGLQRVRASRPGLATIRRDWREDQGRFAGCLASELPEFAESVTQILRTAQSPGATWHLPAQAMT